MDLLIWAALLFVAYLCWPCRCPRVKVVLVDHPTLKNCGVFRLER